MSPPTKPHAVYRERAQRFKARRDHYAVRSRWLSHARLVAFLAAVATAFWMFEVDARVTLPWLLLSVLLFVTFLGLIVVHNAAKQRSEWYGRLAELNEEGLRRLARDWDALPPTLLYDDAAPPVAYDLDLFGRASLFALLGSVGTEMGRRRLRRLLLEPVGAGTVRERQVAVAELAALVDLRENLSARGRSIPQSAAAPLEGFLRWAEGDPAKSSKPALVWSSRALPLITWALMGLSIAGPIPYQAVLLMLAVNLTFSYSVQATIHRTFDRAFVGERDFQQFAELLRALSTEDFESPLLTELQRRLAGGGLSAHRQMRRLERLGRLADVRYSMLHLPVQAFTLWDFRVLLRLERWQATAGRRARVWLETLSEFDALAALATLRFENPAWAFPEIDEGEPLCVTAKGLGHPLIPDDVRVGNDVKVGPPGTFLLITGSNMSGKSTLLRAIGVNVVLARAGAPVCADQMSTPPLELESSMRVHDSLQQGLSHFMAELQTLKRVLDAARRAGKDSRFPLLYLLDDIFQGTNTIERQVAARKVIGHLLSTAAIGAVTSHDLELAATDELASTSVPVHFSEKIEPGPDGPTIAFDYRLRPGIATSKNALKLLEIVGLDPDGVDTRKLSAEPE